MSNVFESTFGGLLSGITLREKKKHTITPIIPNRACMSVFICALFTHFHVLVLTNKQDNTCNLHTYNKYTTNTSVLSYMYIHISVALI